MPSITTRKYNSWCEKRALVCADQDKIRRATAFFTRHDLAPSECATFYIHELTNCEGLEFVAFSNAELRNTILLPYGVVLVPCFFSDIDGHHALCKALKIPPPPLTSLLDALHSNGFSASRTQFSDTAVKTDARIDEIQAILK